jgi:hypothetical protein
MDKLIFLGKLLNAVDAAYQEHKHAQTQSEYLYTQGRLDALNQVVEWIKD